jgi:hypothetical protein
MAETTVIETLRHALQWACRYDQGKHHRTVVIFYSGWHS